MTYEDLRSPRHLMLRWAHSTNGRRIPAICSTIPLQRSLPRPPALPIRSSKRSLTHILYFPCHLSCISRSSRTIAHGKMHHICVSVSRINTSTTPCLRSTTRTCFKFRTPDFRKNEGSLYADAAYACDALSRSPTSSRDTLVPVASASTAASTTWRPSQVLTMG